MCKAMQFKNLLYAFGRYIHTLGDRGARQLL